MILSLRTGLFLFAVMALAACQTKGRVTSGSFESLRLPSLFDDNAVLQRDQDVPVWGRDNPGQHVTVKFRDYVRDTTAGEDGKWLVTLPPMPHGGPDSMLIRGSSVRVLRDVLVGDVWLCSGQSNMVWSLGLLERPVAQALELRDPRVRLFQMTRFGSAEPVEMPRGVWLESDLESLYHSSALAWWFGKSLADQYDVPIGLIQCAWGGTRAEVWIPSAVLAAHPDHEYYTDFFANDISPDSYRETRAEYVRDFTRTIDRNVMRGRKERGIAGHWHSMEFDDSTWKAIQLPGRWEDLEVDADGFGWFRREVNLPEDWDGKDLVLSLGFADDLDETWFNGEFVGQSGVDAELPRAIARRYFVPGKHVKPGRNVVAVRILDVGGFGGLQGPDRLLYARRALDETDTRVSLAGEWRFREEGRFHRQSEPLPREPEYPPLGNIIPGFAWNGMVEPLLPYGIKGFVWYQGEANTPQPIAYRRLMTMLIETWREAWKRQDAPFLIVQLAPFGSPTNSFRSMWAELRESQQAIAEEVPGTGMIVITDSGDCEDIHPADKRTVGRRLALAARNMAYGENVLWRAPEPESVEFQDGRALIEYRNADGGLDTTSDGPAGFLIAGEDRVFYPATAEPVNVTTIAVSAPEVPDPIALRYGWSDCPQLNLFNRAGIPAAPFRTDEWRESIMVEPEQDL